MTRVVGQCARYKSSLLATFFFLHFTTYQTVSSSTLAHFSSSKLLYVPVIQMAAPKRSSIAPRTSHPLSATNTTSVTSVTSASAATFSTSPSALHSHKKDCEEIEETDIDDEDEDMDFQMRRTLKPRQKAIKVIVRRNSLIEEKENGLEQLPNHQGLN